MRFLLFFSDCNGHAPLNNQRALSPQNSVKSYHKTLSPCNSFRGNHPFYNHRTPLSRQNSLRSSHSALSRQNSFRLSRQNSINSQHTLSPQNSIGSTPREEYKQNNLSSETPTPESKVASEGQKDKLHEDDDSDDGLPVRLAIKKLNGLCKMLEMKSNFVCLKFF